MQITPAKIIGLLIAVAYVTAMLISEGPSVDLAKASIGLLFPLALIWFSEELGSFTGYIGRGGNVDVSTPPILISIVGWIFLIGLPALIYFRG